MANIRTHYDNLRVARNAPDSVIKAAYKALCQTYHPDKFQGSNAEAERIMKLINASYVVLIDPVKRAEHDAWIQAQEADANQPREKASFGETGNGTEQEFYQKQETKWKYTPPPTEPEPPEADTSLYLWRRYFARQIDYIICGLVFGILLAIWSATGQSLPNTITATLSNPDLSATQQMINWSMVSAFLWLILEPITLSTFGTTAGKALFRLQLVSDNSEPNYWGRSVAVWAVGMGLGIPVISGLANLNAAMKLKKNGQTDWDKWNGFSVIAEPLSILRRASLAVLVMLLIMANGIIGEIGKHTIPSKQPIQQAQVVQNVPKATPQAVTENKPAPVDTDKVDYSSVEHLLGDDYGKSKQQNQSEATAQHIFQRAFDLCSQGRYAEALPLYQGLAEQGDAGAQVNLGVMYDKGQGVAQDDNQAGYWYHKAAEQGVAHAQFNLGAMYADGQGVAQDYNQAVYWYRKAAEQGNANAIAALKKLEVNTPNTPQAIPSRPLSAYDRAMAAQEFYNQGRYTEALPLLQSLAEQGIAISQSNLGAIYLNGYGVAKDEQKAVYWYCKAAKQGDTAAKTALNNMAGQLSQTKGLSNGNPFADILICQ